DDKQGDKQDTTHQERDLGKADIVPIMRANTNQSARVPRSKFESAAVASGQLVRQTSRET
ncbi:MAG: hypothetical protein O2907_07370, partial [Proteobacteria bacterium]|nr:hypothetical protein [Pseudomonadota bacterium]